MTFPNDYYERLYAGVLGKIIGVYAGRPFEGWTHDQIASRFGEINRYVHEQAGVDLIVGDDDISGTFLFTHALEDHLFRADFDARHVGQTWLDYLVENKTILWWGGLGLSTEHTAWLRLKQGIEAPLSGAMQTNGQTVAEQIGAQIFIDGWALINPGWPEQAVDFARKASRVSHDGEAVHAACLLAAMEAQAFVEKDLDTLLDRGLSYIPAASQIVRVIRAVRQWHRQDPLDWRGTFDKLSTEFGYHKHRGICPVIPNHGLIILALLYGGDSFHEAMKIVNTLGWDTDCNAANVGCLNGIRLGLAALDDGYDWRTPVRDRFFLPSASSHANIFDAVQETDKLLAMATRLHQGESLGRKAKFHFSLPGSLQGFDVDRHPDFSPAVEVENHRQRLAIRYHHLLPDVPARVKTATHTPRTSSVMDNYPIIGCPTLYAGQTVTARVQADGDNPSPVSARLYVETYTSQQQVNTYADTLQRLQPGEALQLVWTLPALGNEMVANVGLELLASDRQSIQGSVYLDELDWTGVPDFELAVDTLPLTDHWQSSWLNTMDGQMKITDSDTLMLVNNDVSDPGVFVHGSEDWDDYRCSSRLLAQLKENFGLIVRYRGLSRFYLMELTRDNIVRLVRHHFDSQTVLAERDNAWQPHQVVHLEVTAQGPRLTGRLDGKMVFDVIDDEAPATLLCGAAGIYNTLGPVNFHALRVEPVC